MVDTHCHLNFEDFEDDLEEVVGRARAEAVKMVVVSSDYENSRRAIELAERYENDVWAAVGLHPIHLGSEQKAENSEQHGEEFDYGKYLALAKNKKVVAIGEVGLDYHHFDTTNLRINYESTNGVGGEINENSEDSIGRGASDFEVAKKEVARIIELQKSVFREFVRMADEVAKPLIIHCWNADKSDRELVGDAVAYEDVLEIVHGSQFTVSHFAEATRDKHGLRNNKRGVVHSFVGNYKTAFKFIEEGFLIGLNGIITYSESYDRLIREIGLENIVLETDAPYLTPAPLERYSRNEPVNVKLVAQKVASVLEVDVQVVADVTSRNARELFGISF